MHQHSRDELLHWAAIIESTDDAVFSKSMAGFITSWNPGAVKLYGYTPEEIIGQPVSILMPEGKRDDFSKIMKQLEEGKKVDHYHTQRQRKDGVIIDVSVTISPIRDEDGKVTGASIIARDITKQMEEERRREDFIGTASHELKTPVTSQKVYGEILAQLIRSNGDTQYLPYIDKLNAQTTKVVSLIEDMLDLSRLESGRLELQNNHFLFDELVAECVESMALTTHHHLVVKGESAGLILGDRDRLYQVIVNYISNAIKYSPKAKQIDISIQTKGKAVVLGVKDEGIGIEAKYHDDIFSRFSRVIGTDERTYPGMGIGLHISKQIIELHGGKVWMESRKGQGSTFYFSVPLTT